MNPDLFRTLQMMAAINAERMGAGAQQGSQPVPPWGTDPRMLDMLLRQQLQGPAPSQPRSLLDLSQFMSR